MKVRQSTIEKMKAVIAFICESLNRKPMKFIEMEANMRRLEANNTLPYLMKKAGYIIYSEGSWTLNRQMNHDQKNILADVFALYKKQLTASYAKKAKLSKPQQTLTKEPQHKPVLSLSSVLSKLPDEKLIEEVQRRGYIVFSS